MKKALVLLTALVLAAGVAIGAENGGKLKVRDVAQLNGQNLNPGDYQVRWEGNGDTVQVTISRGKKVILTANGTLKELPQAAQHDTVFYREANGKYNQIIGLQFAGKKTVIMFDGKTSGSN